ncbi:MAG TPA: oligosaccharide flippase family protein [Sphingomonadaceae bacterium]|nr:oligosaccharide flippase family protein [Sphingomonadaceae bacterium]
MAVRRSLAWMAFGQGGFFCLQFLGSVVVARLLSPYEIGVFAIAMAVVGLVSVVQAIGLNNLLVRERDLTPDLVASAAAANIAICLLLAVTIAVLGYLGEALFKEPGVRHVLLVLAVVPIIGHFAFVPGAMLEREGNFRTIALLKMVSTAIGVGITITLALKGYSYMSLAYSQVATALLTNVATNVVARRHVTFRLSLAHWSKVWRFGLQIFAISGASRIANRTMEVSLGSILGLGQLGLFSRASNNHNMLWDNIHGVVGRVVFVDFSQRAHEGAPLGDRYLRVLELMSGLLWPVFALVAVLAGPLIVHIYGPPWAGAAPPLALLCIASIVLVSTTMSWEVFVVCHETARQVRFEFIRTLLGTGLFIAGCFISLEAAAASRILDALFAQFLYRPHLERMTGTSRHAFSAIYLRSAIATLVAVAPSLALMILWRFSAQTPVALLVLSVGGGGLLWLLALRGLHHALYGEIMTVLTRLRQRAIAV